MSKQANFCISCNAQTIERRLINKRHFFYCRSCGKTNPYAFTVGGEEKQGKSKKGKKMHYTIAAILKDKDKVLVMNRTYYAFGWAGVAGHLHEGEKPVPALKREIEEETGLKASGLKKVYHEEIDGNRCSRGVSVHDWTLYEAKAKGKPKKNDEASEMKWVNKTELAKLELEPVWAHLFKKMGYLKEQKLKVKR